MRSFAQGVEKKVIEPFGLEVVVDPILKELHNWYPSIPEQLEHSRTMGRLLRPPLIATPTLGLGILCVLLWSLTLALGNDWFGLGIAAIPLGNLFSTTRQPEQDSGSVWLALCCLAIATFASYASFTVVHDCIHGAVSRHESLNAIVGR